MSKFKQFLCLLFICMLFLGCDTGQMTSPASTQPSEINENPVPEQPTVSQTDQESGSEPTAQSEAASPTPVNEPIAESEAIAPDPEQGLKLKGFAVQVHCSKAVPCQDGDTNVTDEWRLLAYDTEGALVAMYQLPGAGDVIHAFGDLSNLNFLFWMWENYSVYEISGGTVNQEYFLENYEYFLGVPGLDHFAATVLPGVTDSGHSEIHMIPGVGYVAQAETPDRLVIPVQLEQHTDFDLKLWYTEEPFGIGGDVPFPGWFGLTLFDGQNHIPVLAIDRILSAISKDGNLVAYTEAYTTPMKILDWNAVSEVSFDLLSDSDRGAGYAIFSPSLSLLAWIEMHGSIRTGDIRPTLRVASTAGGEPINWDASQFSEIVGRDVLFMRPVAWVDETRLLIQVEPTYQGEMAEVLLVDLLSSSPPIKIRGNFVGEVWQP